LIENEVELYSIFFIDSALKDIGLHYRRLKQLYFNLFKQFILTHVDAVFEDNSFLSIYKFKFAKFVFIFHDIYFIS